MNTFSPTIDKWLEALRILWVNHPDQGGVYPATSLNAIQTTDDDFELHVVVFILVLDFTDERSDLDALDPPFYKSGSNLSLWLADISLTEKELPIEVRYINGVCFPYLEWYKSWDREDLPISMTWMSLKPESARFLRISQPNPPAPLHTHES